MCQKKKKKKSFTFLTFRSGSSGRGIFGGGGIFVGTFRGGVGGGGIGEEAQQQKPQVSRSTSLLLI